MKTGPNATQLCFAPVRIPPAKNHEFELLLTKYVTSKKNWSIKIVIFEVPNKHEMSQLPIKFQIELLLYLK